jgi:hypothetical protein
MHDRKEDATAKRKHGRLVLERKIGCQDFAPFKPDSMSWPAYRNQRFEGINCNSYRNDMYRTLCPATNNQ